MQGGGNEKSVFAGLVDIITISIPPVLPIILTIGVTIALSRLKKVGILCVEPSRIALAGYIDCFCFDKVRATSLKFTEYA